MVDFKAEKFSCNNFTAEIKDEPNKKEIAKSQTNTDKTSQTQNNNVIDNNKLTKRIKKLTSILSKEIIDKESLINFCWQGIPNENNKHRALCWKYLLGIYPLNTELKASIVKQKKEEYLLMCNDYSKALAEPDKVMNDQELADYRQILKDVPRTMPEYPMFQSEKIKFIMTRVLYIWSMRHPASGYVQGFNDLTIPFFVVYFIEHFDNCTIEQLLHKDIKEFEKVLDEDKFIAIESDIYFSLTKLLDRIQTHYTKSQPGINKMMDNMIKIIKLVDIELANYLKKKEIDYVTFCFRWMNCFLMREFPIGLIIRMWDTYFSEEKNEQNGFRDFHFYVCASLLLSFSGKLLKMTEFQEIIMFLQNLPTDTWTENDIEVLLARSYQIREMYSGFIKKEK